MEIDDSQPAEVCLCCGDEYGELAEECFIAGVCGDCINAYSSEELIEICMENNDE